MVVRVLVRTFVLVARAAQGLLTATRMVDFIELSATGVHRGLWLGLTSKRVWWLRLRADG